MWIHAERRHIADNVGIYNARLIAKAPEMYDFIQRIAGYTTIPWTAEQAKDILRDAEGQ